MVAWARAKELCGGSSDGRGRAGDAPPVSTPPVPAQPTPPSARASALQSALHASQAALHVEALRAKSAARVADAADDPSAPPTRAAVVDATARVQELGAWYRTMVRNREAVSARVVMGVEGAFSVPQELQPGVVAFVEGILARETRKRLGVDSEVVDAAEWLAAFVPQEKVIDAGLDREARLLADMQTRYRSMNDAHVAMTALQEDEISCQISLNK
jgi:hypothetical protein